MPFIREQDTVLGEINLPWLKRYISSFVSISTITLIHCIGRRGGSNTVIERSRQLWIQAEDLAISELRSSSAWGPKLLRVVTVSGDGDRFGPKLVVDEVVV